ncbi:toll/interleukin-1 receptor domain-containing protein [Priestia megaterium]|uniref:toll/interleukin-1 receptor domain-containing protein n=1 Tax=Priestia megaterium TaxID=1404 RepID=UPI00345831E3
MRFSSSTLGNFASMICGDAPFNHFPYRSSTKLTSFFHYLNLNYSHNGTTRKNWVEWVLSELNTLEDSDSVFPSQEMRDVIEYLLHPENFLFNESLDREEAINNVNRLLALYNLRIYEDILTGKVNLELLSSQPKKIDTPLTNNSSNNDRLRNLLETNQNLDAVLENTYKNKSEDTSMKKIFISHAVKDRELVTELINLLEGMGIESNQIFCSSVPGYGIPLGVNFLEKIKSELNGNVTVIFVLTPNFYKSPVCMCEMGATWVQTKFHIPIVVPPLDFKDMLGVISTTQGLKINEPGHLNNLNSALSDEFSLPLLQFNVWERKRDRFIKDVSTYISQEAGVRE